MTIDLAVRRTRPDRIPRARIVGLCLAVPLVLLVASAASRGDTPPLHRPVPPTIRLAWNAPYGSPRASAKLATTCRDTLRSDTLWLTYETPTYRMYALSVSGALVFEPQAGDTLEPFWFFERDGANAGSLNIEFDVPDDSPVATRWKGPVEGHVGYSHQGGRGRLDLSANGVNAAGETTELARRYAFARVIISSQRAGLRGCRRPMSIRWIGARFPTRTQGDLRVPWTADQVVTWNAPKGGVARPSPRLAVETWTPIVAPPSWAALFHPRPGIGIITRTPRDTASIPIPAGR